MKRMLLALAIAVTTACGEPVDVAKAVRLLVTRNHVVAEGAGATALAVALSGRAGTGQIGSAGHGAA